MLLYQIINNKYGSSGVWGAYANQKKIYEGLGSPLGPYTGSAAQNMWLLNNQDKWDAVMGGGQQQQQQQTNTNQETGNAADEIADELTKDVRTPEDFNLIAPKDQLINEELIKGFGEQQANPESYANSSAAYNALRNSMYATGGQRFSAQRAAQQNLLNQYERQRLQSVDQYANAMRRSLTDFYNNEYQKYYEDPNRTYNPETYNINLKKFQDENKNYYDSGNYNPVAGTFKPITSYY